MQQKVHRISLSESPAVILFIMSKERITDLEVRLAYLEKIQEEQNRIIFDQQKAMDGLRKEIDQLQGRLEQIGEQSETINQPPPHY